MRLDGGSTDGLLKVLTEMGLILEVGTEYCCERGVLFVLDTDVLKDDVEVDGVRIVVCTCLVRT